MLCCSSRAVIVHPRFAHALAAPPLAPPPPPPLADWHALPLEVVHAIAAHLEKAEDLLSLAAVCSHTRHLAACDRLWKGLCRRRFGAWVPPEEPGGPSPAPAGHPMRPGFWLGLYQYNHRLFLDMVVRASRQPGGPRFGQAGAGPLLIQLS